MLFDQQMLFGVIPDSLRDELLNAYRSIERNFRERRWEPSELNGGKLCEVVYSILEGHISGTYPPQSSKPRNMVDACNNFAHATGFPRSIRIQIPRMLIALYEVRNNRGVGHVGGDVNPNAMDAACVMGMSKWVVAELVRVFHSVDTTVAEQTVETICDRTLSLIWEVDGTQRVLDTSLSNKDQCLVLLHASVGGLTVTQIMQAVEHKNKSNFVRDVITKLHNDRFINFNKDSGTCKISPKGISFVETEILGFS